MAYDFARRKKANRSQRERGCWVYIPAEELSKAGVPLDGPPPWYRVWATPRGGVFLRLYKSA